MNIFVKAKTKRTVAREKIFMLAVWRLAGIQCFRTNSIQELESARARVEHSFVLFEEKYDSVMADFSLLEDAIKCALYSTTTSLRDLIQDFERVQENSEMQ